MTKEIKSNPPYIAVKKIENLLSKIGSRSYTIIDKQILTGYGFSEGEASQALGTLTFLGIINTDKTVNTEVFNSISVKNPEKKTEAIKNMVESAYSKLFEAFPDVANASTTDIHDEMKRVYSLSTRLASTAVPAFVYLCELSGLREKAETKTAYKQVSTSAASSKKTHPVKSSLPSQESVLQTSGAVVIDFLDGEIKLALPQKALTNPSLIDEYKILVSAVNTFAEKYKESIAPAPASNNDNE